MYLIKVRFSIQDTLSNSFCVCVVTWHFLQEIKCFLVKGISLQIPHCSTIILDGLISLPMFQSLPAFIASIR